MIPKYSINLLHSAARWLAGRSGTTWAREFGHADLMNSYSKDLTELAAHLLEGRTTCKSCGGLINAPLGRERSAIECACVAQDKASPGEQQFRDMGLMIRRLVNKVHKVDPHDPICHQALDLLDRLNQRPNPLRGE